MDTYLYSSIIFMWRDVKNRGKAKMKWQALNFHGCQLVNLFNWNEDLKAHFHTFFNWQHILLLIRNSNVNQQSKKKKSTIQHLNTCNITSRFPFVRSILEDLMLELNKNQNKIMNFEFSWLSAGYINSIFFTYERKFHLSAQTSSYGNNWFC